MSVLLWGWWLVLQLEILMAEHSLWVHWWVVLMDSRSHSGIHSVMM